MQKCNVFGLIGDTLLVIWDLPPRAIHFSKAHVMLMLSFSRHVMPQITTFEMFAVKWQKLVSERTKMVNPSPVFGHPSRYHHYSK